MKRIAKQTSHAFGKKVFLLGINKFGEYMWLEESSWDCGWYWGFGYVVTYTINTSPSTSRDIKSHEHYEGLVGVIDEITNVYVQTLNESSFFTHTVLTDSEAWRLGDYMNSFYALKEAAEIFHRGKSHYTSTPGLDLKNSEIYNHINKIAMPQIFKAVYEILSP